MMRDARLRAGPKKSPERAEAWWRLHLPHHTLAAQHVAQNFLAADVRPLVRFNVSVILEQNGRREQGYAGGGARSDLNYWLRPVTSITSG